MNTRQRQFVIERDGFTCANCKLTCPHSGEKCRPPSANLARAAYFKLEATYHPMNKLQVDHILGRRGGIEVAEAYHHVWSLCAGCHREKDILGLKEKGLAYAAQFEGQEPQEYLDALAEEATNAPKRKAKNKKARCTKRKADEKKAGGSKLKRDYAATKKPKAGKVPSKIAAQNDRPILNSLPNSRI